MPKNIEDKENKPKIISITQQFKNKRKREEKEEDFITIFLNKALEMKTHGAHKSF